MSNSQSRTEQMAYFESELGLDKATAILLYHAERFQEKGQLEMALEFFDQVLSSYPACTEAKVNRCMTAKILDQRKSRERRCQEIVEASETKSPSTSRYPNGYRLDVGRTSDARWRAIVQGRVCV